MAFYQNLNDANVKYVCIDAIQIILKKNSKLLLQTSFTTNFAKFNVYQFNFFTALHHKYF